MFVLAGLAGAGKTELLGALARAGAPTLDLEGLAGHSGSAFGGLGRPAQPTQAKFDAAVAERLAGIGPLFVEDEGAFIGSLSVPPGVRAAIEAAPIIEIVAPREARVARLTAEYQDIDTRALIRATQRIRRRIGGPVADRAISHFSAGRRAAAIDALLDHFDAAYRHRWAGLDRPILARLDG